MIELTDEGRAIMESSISRWRRVRLAQSISHLPLVALTSVPGPHVLTGAGVDCGGSACRACEPTCFDGLQNGGETGVDCGGACAFCIPECDVPNSPDQTCQLPTLSQVSPASGPTGHATPI